MEKVSNLLLKFSQKLFTDQGHQDQFIQALTHPQSFHPCILWTKPKPTEIPFSVELPTSWQPAFVDRLSVGQKPGQNPLHEAGYFYCLDFSSVFAASALLTITQSVNVVVDVCASPGGKSVFAWRSLSPNLMLCNETIGKRMGALISNLKRCEIKPAIAASFDPSVLAETIPKTADVVLVDAPCSGQSLLAKGDKAPGCFHPVNINKNANRQKRILANSAQLVVPQGYLVYMTCAYSPEENEQVGEWFLKRFPQFEPVTIPHLAAYQSHLSDRPCYRMFPQEGLGAGAFTMLFRNQEAALEQELGGDRLTQFLQRPGLVKIGNW